jgi:hypothetical protein
LAHFQEQVLPTLVVLLFLLLPMMSLSSQKQLAASEWGGEHVRLAITAQGGALEFDCAHGAFDSQPKLDARGRFTVAGTYEPEHGGPVRVDENPNAIKVEYVGVVKQDNLRLSVRRVGAKRAFAVFNLVRGQEAMLFKCR